MKRTFFNGLLLCGILQLISSQSMFVDAKTEQKKAQPAVAAQLEGVAAGLAGSKVPVYLPTWLPKFPEPTYATAELNPPGSDPGYVVRLADKPGNDPPQASLLFEIYGSKIPGSKSKNGKVSLGSGRIGYIRSSDGGNAGPSIEWETKANHYSIGKLVTKEDLIHAAKSTVLLPPAK